MGSDITKVHYLNAANTNVNWDDFPCTFDQLEKAIRTFPQIEAMNDGIWKVLQAVLHLGNIKFKGSGEDDAVFTDKVDVTKASELLMCDAELLTKALCTLNIKAGLDWIAKPNTVTVSVSAVHALARALYSKLFDAIVDAVNKSLMFGGDTRYFIGAVDVSSPPSTLPLICAASAHTTLCLCCT